MRIENLWSFNKKNHEAGRQLDLEFVDMKKDKDGKTVYDFLEEAGIKEGDEDYKKILNSLVLKKGHFYVGDVYIKEYLYWKKVYSKEKNLNQATVAEQQVKNKIAEKLRNKKGKTFSEKEQKRRDYMRGQWD